MTVHNKGRKADRDRAVLIHSYHVMVKDFRVPKARRLDDARLASMSNEMLLRVNRDIYSQATVRQAEKLAVKMGLAESSAKRIVRRFKDWLKYTFVDDHFHKGVASAKTQ